jgi:signal transduction histidine kinase
LIPADVAVALFGGIAVANRRAYVESLRDRAERNARRQVDEERLRIARELHDVVAHHGHDQRAGQRRRPAADRSPGAGRRVAHRHQSGEQGRSDGGELRAILNVLRHVDEGADSTQPAPGLARLDTLAAGVRQAGLPVTVTVTGQPRPLPAVTELAAFRIIQEALTNSIRHAGPAAAAVAVSYGDDCLLVEVTDDGGGATMRSGKNGDVTGADGKPLAGEGGTACAESGSGPARRAAPSKSGQPRRAASGSPGSPERARDPGGAR